jgi:hypothetical protein
MSWMLRFPGTHAGFMKLRLKTLRTSMLRGAAGRVRTFSTKLPNVPDRNR